MATNFKVSLTAQAIYTLFVDAIPNGGMVTWQQITDATGRSRRQLNGAVQTAQRRVLREHNVVFENERGVGYRKLKDGELSVIGQRAIDGTRRRVRRAGRKMATGDYAKMSKSESGRHIARQTLLEVVANATKSSSVKKADDMVARMHNLRPEEQLDLLRQVWNPSK